LLMVIAGRAQRLQALDLGLNIVGLQVEVHPFLGDLLVVGALEQHPDLGVRESEQSVDGAALLRQRLLGGIQGGRPERDSTVEVVDVDDELEDAAAVMGSWATFVDEVEHDLGRGAPLSARYGWAGRCHRGRLGRAYPGGVDPFAGPGRRW
jgi:hypothetical protein